MIENPTAKLKETISLYLERIKNEEFRFNLFFKLNSRQFFLFNIYESGKGFLKDYKGLQLTATKAFTEALEEKDEYEHFGEIISHHPFLYGTFIKNSTLYIKNLYLYNQNVGAFEFIIKNDSLSNEIKQILRELSTAMMPYFFDVYVEIRSDVAKRYFSINALNIIKNARPRTFYHSFRVSDLSIAIARQMGLDKKSQRNLCYAALIHDLGEMYIPRDVFYKEGKLTKEEMELIKEHPKNLKNIFAHNPVMDDIIEIAYYHHERMDGKGYYGYKKDDIPIESRILALAETIDGLYTDRPGRKGFEVNEIIAAIKSSAIDVFDEDVVKYAIDIVERYYDKREFNISTLGNINNIGKPTTVIVSKEGKLIFIQGAIEYASNDIVGITFNEPVDVNFSYRELIRIQFPFFDMIYDLKASVISSTDTSLNLIIKGASETTLSNLNVFWEFEAIAIPLKLSNKVMDSLESSKQFIKIYVQRFGSKSLSAKITKSDIKLRIGDTVLLKMKPLKDIITIPAVVSNIIDKFDHIVVYFEYFSLSEKTDAKIHQAIYYKQSKQSNT